MLFARIKRLASFEWRKLIHYLFIALMIIMFWHKERMGIITLTILGVYLIDYGLNIMFMTYQVVDAKFEAVGRGIALSFNIPPGMMHDPGQFIYLNIPWISMFQWHAFSLIVDNSDKEHPRGSLFIMAVGDFTSKLYSFSVASRERPVLWINGPHPSPFMHSVQFNKLIMIATGAGITPALSVAEKFHSQRTVHLLFITRDVDLAKFFFAVLGKVHTTIFFTGSASDFEALQKELEARKAEGDVPLDDAVHIHWTSESDLQKAIPTHVVAEDDKEDVSETENGDIELQCIPESRPVFLQRPPTYDLRPIVATHKTFGLKTKRKNVELVQGKPNMEEEISEIISSHESPRNEDHARLIDNVSFFSEENFQNSHKKILQTKSDWAVLYCGSSQQLNKHIMKECKEMGVLYISEYFESW